TRCYRDWSSDVCSSDLVADVLAGRISVEQIRGRIVLIGSTAAAAADVWATPFDPLLPGVEIHANAIDNLLRGNFLVRNWYTRLLSFAQLVLLGIAGDAELCATGAAGHRRRPGAAVGAWLW